MNAASEVKGGVPLGNGMPLDGVTTKIYRGGPCASEGCKLHTKKCPKCESYVCKDGHMSLKSLSRKMCNCVKDYNTTPNLDENYILALNKYHTVWWRRALSCLLPCWF
jgi:hypothetical protein